MTCSFSILFWCSEVENLNRIKAPMNIAPTDDSTIYSNYTVQTIPSIVFFQKPIITDSKASHETTTKQKVNAVRTISMQAAQSLSKRCLAPSGIRPW